MVLIRASVEHLAVALATFSMGRALFGMATVLNIRE
jgi:hypothetical protein